MNKNEWVTFHMATMPSRVVALFDTVSSILPQCDQLHIYLNNFDQVPAFLIHPKITTYRSQDHLGDIGDVGKFYKVASQRGYIFTVDDKIIYPPDYVAQMIQTIERTGRKAAVSNHGRNFHTDRKCRSYYFDCYTFMYMLGYPLTFVHEVGTGVLAWHSDTLSAPLSWFPHTNMTDIYFSLECQKRKIPLVIHPHKKDWLKLGTKHNETISIHASCNRSDEFQTKVINDFDWEIFTCPVSDGNSAWVESKPDQENLAITFAGLQCQYQAPFNPLAIVLPVFNNLDFTKHIIKTLQQQWTKFLIILINDGSTDGTHEYAMRLISGGNNVIYRRYEKNMGVNASWNEGIRIARTIGSTNIAILNNDLELFPDWEQWMLNILQHKHIGIVSPYSTYGKQLPDKWPQPGSVNPLGFDILGCCFMFRSDLIDTIGYIPETLHTYYGDNWFSHAAHKAGLQVVYCKDSLVHHYYQQTTGKLSLKPQLAADTIAWNKIINQ